MFDPPLTRTLGANREGADDGWAAPKWLRDRRERFAEPFFRRHHAHLTNPLRWVGCGPVLLGLAFVVALGTVVQLVVEWHDPATARWGNLIRAGIALALLLLVVASAWVAIRDQRHVVVLPYFQRRVGEIDTFLAGEHLLNHSRRLDEVAARSGVTPLSAFASGDDLVRGETLTWFDPTDALRTTERLLAADVAARLPVEVVADLDLLRIALGRASAQGIWFCLLIREGRTTSGHEMSMRQGSFF